MIKDDVMPVFRNRMAILSAPEQAGYLGKRRVQEKNSELVERAGRAGKR